MKTIKSTKILLSVILFLGLSCITLNAQNIKDVTSENNHTNTAQETKEKSIKKNSKKNSNFESYQEWNNNYTNDKYQQGSISTH